MQDFLQTFTVEDPSFILQISEPNNFRAANNNNFHYTFISIFLNQVINPAIY